MSWHRNRDMISCEVKNAVTGEAVLESTFPQDTIMKDLKARVAPVFATPPQLIRLMWFDGQEISDSFQIGAAAVEPVQLHAVRLPLRSLCDSPEASGHQHPLRIQGLVQNVTDLTKLGPSAVWNYIDEVSCLLEPMKVCDTSTFSDGTQYTHSHWDYQVAIAACKAMESIGPSAIVHLNKLLTAISNSFGDNEATEVFIHHLLGSSGGGRWRGSYGNAATAFCSLLASLGPDAVVSMHDSLCTSAAWNASGCRAGLAMAIFAKAGLALSDPSAVLSLDIFARSLRTTQVEVNCCALFCMIEMMGALKLEPSVLDPFLENVAGTAVDAIHALSVLERPGRCYSGTDEGNQLLCLNLTCKLLGFGNPLPRALVRDIVVAVLASFSEHQSRAKLALFSHTVTRKSHGAYMWFFKNKYSALASISNMFQSNCEAFEFLMEEDLGLLGDAGSCQKTILMLCFARPLNKCSKVAAQSYSKWLSVQLTSSSCEVRACAIHCLQRIMAGTMVPCSEAIAARLCDDDPFVRQSAASALGCLGGGAARYRNALVQLLSDPCANVRYACLVTLGSITAKAKPFVSVIAAHLTSADVKCRMAALRALKCMGECAAPHKDKLLSWQQSWISRRPEPITSRALLFKDVPLKHLFKGNAPLGKSFAGPSKRSRDERKTAFDAYMQEHTRENCDFWDVQDDAEYAQYVWTVEDMREMREQQRSVQRKFHAVHTERLLRKKQERNVFRCSAEPRDDRYHSEPQLRHSYCSLRKAKNEKARSMNVWIDADWVIAVH